jgi:hypothetical protein
MSDPDRKNQQPEITKIANVIYFLDILEKQNTDWARKIRDFFLGPERRKFKYIGIIPYGTAQQYVYAAGNHYIKIATMGKSISLEIYTYDAQGSNYPTERNTVDMPGLTRPNKPTLTHRYLELTDLTGFMVKLGSTNVIWE